jgi:hypothetical protein
MELANTNDENSFDPTPKLKSSPIPINFISFNWDDNNCISCGEYFDWTYYCLQKYCKKCLSSYLTNIIDNNIYLDVYIFSKNLECSEHEISRAKEPQNIQECCSNCLEILLFKQISVFPFIIDGSFDKDSSLYYNIIESEKQCKLCGKSLYQGTDLFEMMSFKLCSDCYLISSGCVESTLTKKLILTIYLPWWCNYFICNTCNTYLTFTSDSQKYCRKCLIFYTGCRYCLTTNIIFGPTNQSQCKKCKRISFVKSIFSGNSELDDFLLNLFPDINNNLKIDEFVDKIKNIDKYFLPSEMILTIHSICQKYKNTQSEKLMEWIPYPQFTDIKEIARGGFGIIYYAIQSQPLKQVILKKFKNSQDTSKYFLNEVVTISVFANIHIIYFIKILIKSFVIEIFS